MFERVVIIGAGNVAHHITPALINAGFDVCQIYSRSDESARSLSIKTGLPYTSNIADIFPNADIYLFSLSDDAIGTVAKKIHYNNDPLFIHTSGSVSIDIFKSISANYGVLYPLQSFSKSRDINFKDVPVFVEGSSEPVTKMVKVFASQISNSVTELSSQQRKTMHLAAVWASNFPNYMYQIASQIIESAGLDFEILRPLIAETADKVMNLTPYEAQTGPARRCDRGIISMHKELLKKNPQQLTLYAKISEMIMEQYKKRDDDSNVKEDEDDIVEVEF